MRPIALVLVLVALSGCDEGLKPPKIWIDLSPVNLGIHEIDPDAGPYDFNLMLSNRGEEKLVIQSVVYRGDQNCSLTFEGPDLWELGEEEAAFIQGHYLPTVPGEDQVAMTVYSNSKSNAELVVPICGKAVPAGTEDPGEQPVCQVPPVDQPDCENP